MSEIKMSNRDWDLLRYVEEQGFVTFGQIRQNFFKNDSTCSHRLKVLCYNKYLEKKALISFFKSEKELLEQGYYFPHILNLNIRSSQHIYYLGRSYARGFGKSSGLFKRSMVLHQLILTDLRKFLMENLDYKQLNNDPMLQILGGIQVGRNKEIVPDLSFEYDKLKIAVELERSHKNSLTYSKRFIYFRDSIYTHVIYYYTEESILRTLIKKANFDPKFAFAHYRSPDDLISNVWGRLSLNEFVFKVLSTQKR